MEAFIYDFILLRLQHKLQFVLENFLLYSFVSSKITRDERHNSFLDNF